MPDCSPIPCVRLNQQTVVAFLERHELPAAFADIQFGLDAQHGCVFSASSVARVLCRLAEKGTIEELYMGTSGNFYRIRKERRK